MKALIVDDHALTLRLEQRLFAQAGWETEVAQDGATALAKVSDFEPDLVVLDLSMPDKDGLEVLVELRTEFLCHVMILSGLGRDLLWPVAEQLGASDYVEKGTNGEEILALAQDVLERPVPPLRYAETLRRRAAGLI